MPVLHHAGSRISIGLFSNHATICDARGGVRDHRAITMALSPGARLGPHGVPAPIGVGGMGEVYRARDTRLNRDVAINVLPEDVATSPDRLARFEREAKAVAGLSHPNIRCAPRFRDGLASTKPRSGEVGHNLGTVGPDRGSRFGVSL